MIKVLLADDQELIRQSLSFVMSKQEDIEMVGTAANVKRWNSWRKSSPTWCCWTFGCPRWTAWSVPAASSRSFRASRSSS